MQSYGHPNSSIQPPAMSGNTLRLYRAALAGEPVILLPNHGNAAAKYDIDDIRLLCERLDCDRAAAALNARGVTATVVSHDATNDDLDSATSIVYYEAAVHIWSEDGVNLASVDSAAAFRILQRLGNSITLANAVARTLEQCGRPAFSESAIRNLERDADAHVRRVLQEDTEAIRRAL